MNDCGVSCRERIENCGTPGRRALRIAYRTLAVGRDHWARRCRNYRLCTNPFVCTVCRCAVGDVCERRQRREERAKRSGRIKAIGERALHAMTEPLIQQGGACPIPTAVYRKSSVGRGHVPAGELPNPYKPVRLHRLPLRGRHAQWSCPTIHLSETFMWRYSTPRRYNPRVQAPGSKCASPRHAASTPSISAGFSVVNDRRTAHRPRRRSSSFLSSR